MVNRQEADDRDACILYFSRGVPEAFKVIFFEHYSEFFSFSMMLLQQRQEARQVTMEAFFLLWNRLQPVEGQMLMINRRVPLSVFQTSKE